MQVDNWKPQMHRKILDLDHKTNLKLQFDFLSYVSLGESRNPEPEIAYLKKTW